MIPGVHHKSKHHINRKARHLASHSHSDKFFYDKMKARLTSRIHPRTISRWSFSANCIIYQSYPKWCLHLTWRGERSNSKHKALFKANKTISPWGPTLFSFQTFCSCLTLTILCPTFSLKILILFHVILFFSIKMIIVCITKQTNKKRKKEKFNFSLFWLFLPGPRLSHF